MPFLRLHTATRVVLGASKENVWTDLPADQSVVEVTFDARVRGVNNEFIRLSDDGKVFEAATDAQIDASNVDEIRVGQKRNRIKQDIGAIIDDIADNGATLAKLTLYFNKLRKLR